MSFTLLGLPLGAIVFLVLRWFALRGGVDPRVVQVSGFVIVPLVAWFIARGAVREAEGYKAREGRVVEDAPVWPSRREWLLWFALPLAICIPLHLFPGTILIGNVLLNIAIGAAIVWLVSRKERRDIRRARRAQGRCERCGYSLADTLSGVCPECGNIADQDPAEPSTDAHAAAGPETE